MQGFRAIGAAGGCCGGHQELFRPFGLYRGLCSSLVLTSIFGAKKCDVIHVCRVMVLIQPLRHLQCLE